jgi:GH24 family phage-related lysozyme (muramidase)
MKFTQKQIDEGVKDLVMALLATAASGVGLKYSYDQFNASREPIEVKVQAVKQAKEISDDPQFDKTMDALLKKYKSAEPEKKPEKAILVKPNKRYDPNPEVSIEQFSKYIIPSEIYGNDLRDKSNRKFFKPYPDDVGLWTIGIGHLIGNGSYSDMQKFVAKNGSSISIEQLLKMFDVDVQKHVNIAKNKFKDQWEEFSPELKMALVDISFRGDLLKPKSKDDFNFVKQIKNRKFKDAAASYLDHTEYKARMAEGGKDGVVTRMNRNAKYIANEKPRPILVNN